MTGRCASRPLETLILSTLLSWKSRQYQCFEGSTCTPPSHLQAFMCSFLTGSIFDYFLLFFIHILIIFISFFIFSLNVFYSFLIIFISFFIFSFNVFYSTMQIETHHHTTTLQQCSNNTTISTAVALPPAPTAAATTPPATQ